MRKIWRKIFGTAALAFMLCLAGLVMSGEAQAERFVDNRNGTVTDTQTNLVWIKHANPFGKLNQCPPTENTEKYSHAATGTYIDCIHGCPDLIVCTNCCNKTFSSILTTCNANRDNCEALCPPGNADCLDACMMARNDCLKQDMQDFDCPHWKAGDQQQVMTKRSECKECHEDDR